MSSLRNTVFRDYIKTNTKIRKISFSLATLEFVLHIPNEKGMCYYGEDSCWFGQTPQELRDVAFRVFGSVFFSPQIAYLDLLGKIAPELSFIYPVENVPDTYQAFNGNYQPNFLEMQCRQKMPFEMITSKYSSQLFKETIGERFTLDQDTYYEMLLRFS